MPKEKKIRQFEIMQQFAHFNNSQLHCVFEWLDKIDCEYLAVKHDLDDKAEHFHLFVRLAGARSFDDIARQCNIKKQYIQKIEKGWSNALAYAFHLSESAKNDGKYKYDNTAVIKSKSVDVEAIFEKNKNYEAQKIKEEELVAVLYKYGECKASKSEVIACFKDNAELFNKYSLLYEKMRRLRQLLVKEREMLVVYITGGSGTGKTTFARYLAKINNYDCFVSGSGADVLDGYDKEECIVLDDLRGDAFKKHELFKLTDNNTNSSVKSRYANKDISYCKLMIITSIKTPAELYNWSEIGDDKGETFLQFSRRLNFIYIKINDNGDFYEFTYGNNERMAMNIVASRRLEWNISQVYAVMGIEKALGSQLMQAIYKIVTDDIKANGTKDDDKKDGGTDGDLPF